MALLKKYFTSFGQLGGDPGRVPGAGEHPAEVGGDQAQEGDGGPEDGNFHLNVRALSRNGIGLKYLFRKYSKKLFGSFQ